ncbi:transporter substrate-binding domain-containing protein [Catenovulum sp. SM1970]|uniref:substrate-binding periplasmic protein n=1 Tax=Marinifaba aquimaris TaxID=2741323 RepID=UPI00157199D5|nr:transporter substrate-binding domain-containing protein [Marinifaba aquimaris]NTS77208.1 transporter substrate-binding domain-containing protein [Marinifaba aquimaris]
MTKVLYILSFLFVLSQGKAFAQTQIKFSIENNWPPFANFSGKSLSKDKVTQALNLVDLQSTFIIVPKSKGIYLARTGQVDAVLNLEKTPNNQNDFIFGEQPLFDAEASFFYPADSTLDARNFADLPDGTRVVLVKGYDYGEDYYKHSHRFKETIVASLFQSIDNIISKKADVGVMLDIEAQYYLSRMKLPPRVIKKGEVHHTKKIYAAFSKRVKQAQKWADKLDEGLQKIEQTN